MSDIHFHTWPELMDREKALAYVSLGRTKFNELVGAGDIKSCSVDRKTMFRKRDLDAWIKRLPSANTPERRKERRQATLAASAARQGV